MVSVPACDEPASYADPFGDEVRCGGDPAVARDAELDQWFDQRLAEWESERDELDDERLMDAAISYGGSPW